MKKLILIISFFFSACGIEVPQPIPRLYAPNGLVVKNVQDGGIPASTFRLTWWGVNPEEGFVGYNIYYATNSADASSYKNGTRILCTNFNPKQATVVVKPPFNQAKQFTYDIKKFYYANKADLFTNGYTYWFWITAYNSVRNLESPPSQYNSREFFDNIAGGNTP